MAITVHRHVEALPDVVWSLLTDLSRWPDWGPTVTGAVLTHGTRFGLGARGRVWTPVGLALPFEVVSFTPGREWSWNVAGVRATSHTVEADGAGTRLGMSAPVWAPVYVPVLLEGMRRIDRLARQV